MDKICTDVEQSKKLIEEGINVNTADMFWEYDHNTHTFNDVPKVLAVKNWDDPYNKNLPAWSLSALLGLMPTFTLNGYGNGQFNCRDERADCYALLDTCPLDVAFEMVVWLKEKDKL